LAKKELYFQPIGLEVIFKRQLSGGNEES